MTIVSKLNQRLFWVCNNIAACILTFFPAVVVGLIVYAKINDLSINNVTDGLTTTEICFLAVILLIPLIKNLSNNMLDVLVWVISLYFAFQMMIETQTYSKFLVLLLASYSGILNTWDLLFGSLCWLYDKYCKDTAWDRFVSKY